MISSRKSVIDSASGRVPVLPLAPSHRTVGVSENYAGTGSAVRQTPAHPAYALFGLPSIVTVPLASP